MTGALLGPYTAQVMSAPLHTQSALPPLVQPAADTLRGTADLFIAGGSLALLVKGHDDDRSPVAPHNLGVVLEGILALLERDGVDDALALA